MIKDQLLYSSTLTSASETEFTALPNSSGPKQLRGSEGSLLAQRSRLLTTDDSS